MSGGIPNGIGSPRIEERCSTCRVPADSRCFTKCPGPVLRWFLERRMRTGVVGTNDPSPNQEKAESE